SIPVKKRLICDTARAKNRKFILNSACAIRWAQIACKPEYVNTTSNVLRAAGSCSNMHRMSSFITRNNVHTSSPYILMFHYVETSFYVQKPRQFYLKQQKTPLLSINNRDASIRGSTPLGKELYILFPLNTGNVGHTTHLLLIVSVAFSKVHFRMMSLSSLSADDDPLCKAHQYVLLLLYDFSYASV